MDPHAPLGARGLSGRYVPERPDGTAYVLRAEASDAEADLDGGLPIPPSELWAGMADSRSTYLSAGRSHHAAMLDLLGSSGFGLEPGDRVYELGCATGRVLRHFASIRAEVDAWGSDLSAPHIHWCQRWLSPPFHFFTNTTFPYLPIPDDHFDLIYAMSVFTHIGDLEDAWLLELKRVLKPGGRLYVTIHDNHTIDLLLSSPPGHWLHDSTIRRDLLAFDKRMGILRAPFDLFVTSREEGNSQVFHDRGYVERTWGELLRILAFRPEAMGYQTAVLMTK